MTRIRAKTDWQGDTGIIANDQDYQFDLEQIQVHTFTISDLLNTMLELVCNFNLPPLE